MLTIMKNSERRELKAKEYVNSLIGSYKHNNIDITLIDNDSIREKYYLKNKFYPEFFWYHKYDPKSFKINFKPVYFKKEWNLFVQNINEYSKIYIFICNGDITLFVNNPHDISNLFDENFEYDQDLKLTNGLIIWNSKSNDALYIGDDVGLEFYKLI